MSEDIPHASLTRAISAIAITVLLSTLASALEPISLPATDAVAAFVVVRGDEKITVTVPELEALGLYRVTTKSPWEAGEFTFEGVLFSDVIEHLGLADASAIRVQAVDDYTQDIPREDWLDKPLILATRQDGIPLTRRMQGPTRLIYPLAEYPAYDARLQDPRWVWLIKTIEPLH
jgi:hypothetical protein